VIITNADGCLAIVRTPHGTYLPGGGQEPGEAPATTAAREAREECGLHILVKPWRTCAIEHVDAPDEGAHFEKRSVFCDGVVVSHTALPQDADHQLSWIPLPDAVACLSPFSHRWAVTEWQAEHRSYRHRGAAV
jgi:8-oxo-dGTP diphosphatase